MSTAELLKGQVVEIRHQKDNGWGICYVMVAGKPVSVVGVLPTNLQEDDVIEVVGNTKEHPVYGLQFNVQQVTKHMSTAPGAIEDWLTSNLPNIGPVRAKALLDRFGTGLWGIIERDPKQLLKVNGITEERVAEIVKAYGSVSDEREVTIWLLELGLDAKHAAAAIRSFGVEYVREQVEDNPYALDVVRGLFFEKIDAIALDKLKYPRGGAGRIQAYMRVVMNQALMNGDCYMVRHTLLQEVSSTLRVEMAIVDTVLAAGVPGLCVRDGKKVLLEDIDADEAEVASVIGELLSYRSVT